MKIGRSMAIASGLAVLAILAGLSAVPLPSLAATAAQAASSSKPTPASGQPRKRSTGPRKAATPAGSYAAHAGMRDWAGDVARRRDLPLPWVKAALAPARRLPAVQRLIMPPPPGMAKNWAAYRARFIEPERIAAGVAFGRTHEPWLRQAEQRWGVPPAIVLGIIGVETFYGRVMGSFRALDALATLAFDFPSGRSDRSPFFRDELEQLLVWCHREGIEPASVLGSYAGAIGLGQFMPSSILRHAVDFDGDGKVDLSRSAADVIGSVAHYLSDYKWAPGMPTRYAVAVPDDAEALRRLLAPDIEPTFDATQMEAAGARLEDAGRAHVGPLALVRLENGDAAPSHVAGTANFYAITRYNRSSYYAMAVIELGEAVAAAMR